MPPYQYHTKKNNKAQYVVPCAVLGPRAGGVPPRKLLAAGQDTSPQEQATHPSPMKTHIGRESDGEMTVVVPPSCCCTKPAATVLMHKIVEIRDLLRISPTLHSLVFLHLANGQTSGFKWICSLFRLP